MKDERDERAIALGILWLVTLGFLVATMLTNPRTPAEWKAGYEAAVKSEQARHAEAMGGEKAQGRERNER